MKKNSKKYCKKEIHSKTMVSNDFDLESKYTEEAKETLANLSLVGQIISQDHFKGDWSKEFKQKSMVYLNNQKNKSQKSMQPARNLLSMKTTPLQTRYNCRKQSLYETYTSMNRSVMNCKTRQRRNSSFQVPVVSNFVKNNTCRQNSIVHSESIGIARNLSKRKIQLFNSIIFKHKIRMNLLKKKEQKIDQACKRQQNQFLQINGYKTFHKFSIETNRCLPNKLDKEKQEFLLIPHSEFNEKNKISPWQNKYSFLGSTLKSNRKLLLNFLPIKSKNLMF